MPTIADRFRILDPLKRAHDIETLLGEGAADARRVVIKTILVGRLGNDVRARIERETEALRTLDTRALAPNALYAEERDLFYLVRPFVPGVTLAERLARGPLSVGETLTVGLGLMAALRDAHARGVHHLDVKPTNLIVDNEARIECATLVDFSLPRREPTEALRRDQPADSVRYSAPEALGLLHREVAEGADLYSAGIVLHECLAGCPPFEGTIGEVLRQHLSARPPSLRSLGLPVPRSLDEVIDRLLLKDPRDRYQSAHGVLADLEAIAEALGRGISEPALLVGIKDRRHTLTEPAFVGRVPELEALDAAVLRAAGGQGGLVYVEAGSGGGKTRLLDELPHCIARREAWILRGQGVEQAAQRPYQVLSGVVAGILAAAKTDTRIAERLRERLGAHREAVCDALPELVPILGAGSTVGALGPEALGELRTLRALSRLLDSLGSEEAPAVVMLDGCQWADDLSLKLIGHWQLRPDVGSGERRNVLLVAAFRSEEVSPDHLLRAVAPSTRLVLAPLRSVDVQGLVESMAGPLPREVIATVARLSEGSPFMASAILRGLAEAGALVSTPEGWVAEPRALSEARSSRQAAEFLTRRIRRLPPATIEFLCAAAVLGKEFDLELASSLAGLASDDGLRLFGEAQRLQVVWTKEHGRYEFVHDKLRETVLDLLPADRRRALHLRAAELLEAEGRGSAFELAFHYDAASEAARALPHALAAAEQSRAQRALEAAERNYRIAERGAAQADAATRLRISMGLGDVLTLRGRYQEATRWFDRARPLAPDDLTRARIESRVGEVAFKSSDYDTALRACERGLRLLGRRVPQAAGSFLLLFLWESVVQVLHGLFPSVFLGRRKLGTRQAEADLLAISLYDRLIYLWYWAHSGKLPAGWACLRALNLAETYPPTVALGHGYSVLSNITAGGFPPLASWSLKLRQRALAIQDSVGTLHGRGQALAYCWPVSHAVMRFDEGIDRARKGLQLLEVTGDQWDVNASYWGVALCQLSKGEVREAVEECRRLYRRAKDIDDHQNVANALWVWAQASGGRVPHGSIDEALKRPGIFFATRICLLAAEGIRRLGEGQPEAALVPLEDACSLALGKGLIDTMIGDALSWHASALRMAAAKIPAAGARRREALLAQAAARARQARRFGRIYPLLRPFALRESGLVAAARGQPRRARRFLDRALAVAERQGMRLQRALALRARGEAGSVLGWSGAEGDLGAAERELHSLEATAVGWAPPSESPPASLSLVDRFVALLDKGRAVVTALSHQAAINATREVVITTLRVPQCVFLEVASAGNGVAVLRVEPADAQYARALVERAVAAASPVVFSADSATEADEELIRSGLRAAICAPIFVRDHVGACIYAASDQVAELFGDQEVRLTRFIASLAGAALENALSVSELDAAHKTMQTELERRVAERTAELQAANQELESFSYSVSHDLRAPLRSIDGFSQALLEDRADQLDETGRKHLRYVRQSTREMAELIDGLLALARVTRSPLRREHVDLSQLAHDVVGRLQGRSAEPGRRVDFVVQEGLSAEGDVRLLAIVLENLLSNAWKFTSKRPQARIEFGLSRHDGHPAFFVRDDGAGFDMAYVGKLFGAFQRLHAASEFEGHGVGLATVQRIVRRHRGRIWAEGQVGVGATFYFSLGEGERGQ